MAGVTCFICGTAVTDDDEKGTLKERSLKTFIDASKRRKDGHDVWLASQTCVVVHEKCRKGSYTKEASILKAERGASNVQRVSRQQTPAFNFKELCFICGKDASENFLNQQRKLPASRRDKVHNVMTMDMITTVREMASATDDDVGRSVLQRIANESDLVAAEARYHFQCYKSFSFRKRPTKHVTPGRPESSSVKECIDFIADYLQHNEDECQFVLDDILEAYQGVVPRRGYVLEKLAARFGDDLIVAPGSSRHRQTILCFRNTGHTILSDNWYKSRKTGMDEERMRVVKAAAEIIREDIRSKVYTLDKYPSPDHFLQSVTDDISPSLQVLLDTITKPSKQRKSGEKQSERTKNKVQAIAHSLISLTRPRSFTSPLLLGVGTLLYRKYGSRHLVDVLSGLGFSSSYGEVRKFEVSSLLEIVTKNSFTQFIFDNADINMDTIDGNDTFHAMGGIQCFTPKRSLIPRTPVDKVKSIPKAYSLRAYGSIPVQHFDQPEGALSTITVTAMAETVVKDVLPRLTDVLWMYGKWKHVADFPGWSGFMETITSNHPYQTSHILCLPFIRAPPSNVDTVYTALQTAALKCKEQRQKYCFVTFDHPLWLKARRIISSTGPDSELNCVIVRLGGFHLLMSFMSAIGFIMDGSGLQDLFNVCFALASTKTMLSGHYYSRAVRAHIMAHLALGKIILSTMELLDEENEALLSLINNFKAEEFCIDNPYVDQVTVKFKNQLDMLEKRGSTAKLWVQYFRMISILKLFVEAERSGNWGLHLESVKQMMPYFHASGHFNYAKACHLNLQDMHELEGKLTPAEYDQFVTKGYFTIRRSPKHWSGIWSDMTIEQVLMRAISACGGLSRGRGISDGTLARWIAGMPIAVDVTQQVEEYCGSTFSTSDQHVDTTMSRVKRDDIDVAKLSNWFECHNPFPQIQSIMCISTGVLGGDNINCHEAFEKGTESIKSIEGNNFKDAKLHRKNRVVPLRAVKGTAKINGESDCPISPDTLFRRIPFHMKSPQQLESYFTFELAPYPLSLFDENGIMRKTKKSDLYKFFTPVTVKPTTNADYVVDGGFLLHRVVWGTGEIFSTIVNKYVSYVTTHYISTCTVVFDGYPDNVADKSTKCAERARRVRAASSSSVLFQDSSPATRPKERFLLNEQNKKQLITQISTKLVDAGVVVKQAHEDADTLIVDTALQQSGQGGNVFIVAEDIYLLVLLTARVSNLDEPITNIFLLKPGRQNQDTRVFSPDSCKMSENTKKHLLVLHSFSGCDTTSSFFRQGKIKFIKKFEKDASLHRSACIFELPSSSADEIAEAGIKLIRSLYNQEGSSKSLNQLRLELFQRALSKKQFNLASLPPTEAAARQHSLRVFLQVQMWMNNELHPQQWGWGIICNELSPITTNQPPAPQELLNSISCTCKKGCRAPCSYRKAGIKCSALCFSCKGHACLNSSTEADLDEAEKDQDEDLNIEEERLDLDSTDDEQDLPVEEEENPGPSTAKRKKAA